MTNTNTSSFSLMKGASVDRKNYSFFAIDDNLSYYFFSVQQVQMWLASEIPYTKDMSDYKKLTPRMQQLIDEILGFFATGDGLVNASVLRQMQSAKTSMEVGFLFFQGAIEVVHQQVYGLFIKMFSETPDKEERIFNMVNDVECVKLKADFITKYIDSDIPDCLRNLAQACAEGIFFVTLFAIIFFFRRLNVLEAFIFANEQISKDETVHRDYYCAKAEENNIINYAKEADAIIEEAIMIEIKYVKHLLRTPVQEDNLDQIMGLTVENLTAYIQLLADQIRVFCGLSIKYNSKPNLAWMPDLGLEHKNNFYERKVGNYKKGSLQTLLNWKASIGIESVDGKVKVHNGVENPESVIF